jgi:solute carrier family 25 carnitine/acylcarnitine transporter 20/29
MDGILKDLLAGSIGGAAGCLLGHPLDTMKVRMQSSPADYSSFGSTFKRIIKLEGPKGFFKGVSPPLLSVAVYQAVCFASFSPALRLFTPLEESEASMTSLFLAGSISGAATVLVTTPTDLLKIRQQLQKTSDGGLRDMAKEAGQVFRNEGVAGFYRGAVATAMRDTWSTGLYFVTYHIAKKGLVERDFNGAGAELIAGGLAGMMAWGSCLPTDVVKTRLQSGLSTEKRWLPTFLSIARNEGAKGLFSGGAPLITRAFFVNSVTFYAYEEACRALD